MPRFRISLIIATGLGLTFAVFLIVANNAEQVGQAMLLIGWGLVPITLFHALPLFLSAMSWRELFPRTVRPGVLSVSWIRWIRESINTLLPVGGVGGDIEGVRLAHRCGAPGAPAVASMVGDLTVGVITQWAFVMVGLALLLDRADDTAAGTIVGPVLAGMAVFALLTGIFLLVQHKGMFALSTKLAAGLLKNEWLSERVGNAAGIDEAVRAIYRERGALARANLWRLMGWAAGTGEIWLIMHFLGRPMGVLDAFVLESMGSGVRAAAFMIPGALGVLEGSFVLFGTVFGLAPQIALAIPLSKRVREIGLGVPGLLVWQWLIARGAYAWRRDSTR